MSILNATLISFALDNLFAFSAFHTFNSFVNSKQSFTISNSFFSHSISNIIHSSNRNINLFISKTRITDTLASAIFLDNANGNINCSLGNIPYTSFLKSKLINGTDNWDPSSIHHHLSYLSPECDGSINILNCLFYNCYCTDDSLYSIGGGAIFVNYPCQIFIHGTIFDSCYTRTGRGGALMITGGAEPEILIFMNDSLTIQIDIQYCCFQNCYGVNVYGAAAFLAAQNTTLHFVSSLNCSDEIKSYGAQFDIQGEIVKSTYVNVTGGKSKFCVSIESRGANNSYFQFNTLLNITGCYGLAFSFGNNSVVSYSNICANGLGDTIIASSLFCAISCSLNVSHCYFIDCAFETLALISNTGHSQIIIFSNCVSNTFFHISSIVTLIDYIDNTSSSNFVTSDLKHVNLGECKGAKLPETLTFCPSHHFSPSNKFTLSNKFIPSDEFSVSSTFTASNTFTPSDGFTPSVLVDYNDDEKEKGIYETYSSSQTVSYVLSVSYSITQRISYFYSYTMINEEMTQTLFSTIEEIYNRILIQRLITTYINVEYDFGIKHDEHISASLIIGIVFGAGGLFLIISIIVIFIIKRKRKYHQLIKPKSIQDHDDLYTSSDFRSDEAYERETEINRRKSENTHTNPLFNEHCIDDPFANDFDNQD